MDAREISASLSEGVRNVVAWLTPRLAEIGDFNAEDIKAAERLGLISIDDDGKARTFSLTDLGREVASLLKGEADE
jgi:hypothetical protein